MTSEIEDNEMGYHSNDSEESKSDNESTEFLKMNDPDVCPTQENYNQFKKQWNDERRRLKTVREKLENEKKKRSVSKKIIYINKLPSKMRLPAVKEAMMLYILREKIFCNVKIVDATILRDGRIVKRVMKQVGVNKEEDKINYRRHFELAITKKIGEFRSNSIRKLRKTYMGKRDDLTGKCCVHTFSSLKIMFLYNKLTIFHGYLLWLSALYFSSDYWYFLIKVR
jgi:hypothetical protein